MIALRDLIVYSSEELKPDAAVYLRHLGLHSENDSLDTEQAKAIWDEFLRAIFRVRWLYPYQLASRQSSEAETVERLCRLFGIEIGQLNDPKPRREEWALLPIPNFETSPTHRLSIIVVSRNDDHGGHLQPRMQAFLDSLVQQSERHRCPIEIIIVEWNPPAGRPRFRSLLRFPKSVVYTTIRIIEVPSEIHQTFHYAQSQALYQMIGKNVGIRRGRGEYILCTNVDILFSNELFAFMAQADFDSEAIYRCDRHDATQLTRYDAQDAADLLHYCATHTIRHNRLKGTYTPNGKRINVTYPEDGDCSHLPFSLLHTNGCGDFQLMDRAQWLRLGGYAEIDAFSLHIDSILQITAHFAGLKEIRLEPPLVCHHIDHDSGWSPQAEEDGSLEASLKARKLPRLEYGWIIELARIMKRRDDAITLNQANWGLADRKLPEEIVCQGEIRAPASASTTQPRYSGLSYIPRKRPPIITDQEWPPPHELRHFVETHFDRVSELVAKLARGRSIYLWGAGKRGELLLAAFAKRKVPIAGFVDSDPRRQGEAIGCIEVREPVALAKLEQRPYIIVASMFGGQIKSELRNFGFKHEVDYFDPVF